MKLPAIRMQAGGDPDRLAFEPANLASGARDGQDEITMPKILSAAIPIEHLVKLRRDIDSLGSRCLRKGMPEPELTMGPAHFIADPRYNVAKGALVPQIEVSDVTMMVPERVAMAGWSLLGRVDALPDGRPLVARTPGTEDVPLPPLRSPYECVHCGKVRDRRETFLMVHVSGRTAQVGRTCLRDFLGHDPAPLLWWAARIEEWRTRFAGYSGGGVSVRFYRTDAVLTLAARVASHGGYMGRGRARQINEEVEASGVGHIVEPTSAKVSWRLDPPPFGRTARTSRTAAIAAWDARYPDDAPAQDLLALTRSELARVSAGPTSEWEANVAAVTAQQLLREIHLGIAVSAVVLGLKLTERAAKARNLPPSAHMGSVGERLRDLDAVITLVKTYEPDEGDWSARTLIKFQTAGAALTWWATGIPRRREHPYAPWTVGNHVRLTGTVREHATDRYDGRPTTLLTRCVLEEITNAGTASP
jgi:hypothetical protein